VDICVDNPAVQSSHDHEDFTTLERRGQVESIRQHCIVILVRSQKIFKSAKKSKAKETKEEEETKEKFETQKVIKKEKEAINDILVTLLLQQNSCKTLLTSTLFRLSHDLENFITKNYKKLTKLT